jgi:hypothetical protein
MKRSALSVLAVALAFAGSAFAQNAAKTKGNTPAPAANTPQKQAKLVKVRTLQGVEENRQFQANVQLVQGQRQAAVELDAKVKAEKDPKKKAEMQKQLDAQLAKLNENNAAMEKAYGFSLARNYTLDIETAHIYMLVTDEEAAMIEKQQKEQAAAAKTADPKAKTKK